MQCGKRIAGRSRCNSRLVRAQRLLSVKPRWEALRVPFRPSGLFSGLGVQHFPGFDGAEHGAEVITVRFGQFFVGFHWLAV
jgi:hypothetical protein